ncbi:MAG: hypothetical protein DWQ01_10405 [Planctomycetota bacterium]|nr:MAG: hypothetical protein DWQ01_10405 [Planctomycetota bacterium]
MVAFLRPFLQRWPWAWLLLIGSPALAQQTGRHPAKPLRVLFLGNSYTQNNQLPRLVRSLGEASEPPWYLSCSSNTPGGFSFEAHAKNKRSKRLLQQREWDFVVLQEQSQRPLLAPEKTMQFGSALAEAIEERGARVLFFMTWARAHDPESQQALSRVYRRLAASGSRRLAPVGEAWQDALRLQPNRELHREDGSHPNFSGSLLAALVLFGNLTGADFQRLTLPAQAPLTAEDFRFLLAVADRYVDPGLRPAGLENFRASTAGSSERILLQWNRSRGRGIAGYRILRRISEAGEDGAMPFQYWASPAAQHDKYRDYSVQSGKRYEYRGFPVFHRQTVVLKPGKSHELNLPLDGKSRQVAFQILLKPVEDFELEIQPWGFYPQVEEGPANPAAKLRAGDPLILSAPTSAIGFQGTLSLPADANGGHAVKVQIDTLPHAASIAAGPILAVQN